jgi:hypothetical protein
MAHLPECFLAICAIQLGIFRKNQLILKIFYWPIRPSVVALPAYNRSGLLCPGDHTPARMAGKLVSDRK